jgi:hypothetical protein
VAKFLGLGVVGVEFVFVSLFARSSVSSLKEEEEEGELEEEEELLLFFMLSSFAFTRCELSSLWQLNTTQTTNRLDKI